jgi:hypothetical protein
MTVANGKERFVKEYTGRNRDNASSVKVAQIQARYIYIAEKQVLNNGLLCIQTGVFCLLIGHG